MYVNLGKAYYYNGFHNSKPFWMIVKVCSQTYYVKTQSAFNFGKPISDSVVCLLRLSYLGV